MKLTNLTKRMIATIVIIGMVFILGSIVYYRSFEFLSFFYGIIIGSAVSIAKVFILERTVDKALAMEPKKAGYHVGIHHLLRLLLSGVVLALGAIIPQISLWGVAIGILAFQLAVFNVKFTLKN